MSTNTVTVAGNLADDPYYDTIERLSYIRFDLVVPRDPQLARQPDPKSTLSTDLLRVVQYGISARINYFYLRKGARVTARGWLETRRYLDRSVKRFRRVMEINAVAIEYGAGCDFERGDTQRARLLKQFKADGEVLPTDVTEHEQLKALIEGGTLRRASKEIGR